MNLKTWERLEEEALVLCTSIYGLSHFMFILFIRAKWRETIVAVKQLHSQGIDDQVQMVGFLLLTLLQKGWSDFRSEAEILKKLRVHPNVGIYRIYSKVKTFIVLFMGITSPPQHVTIITEYCANGSLYRFLHRFPFFVNILLKIMQ